MEGGKEGGREGVMMNAKLGEGEGGGGEERR